MWGGCKEIGYGIERADPDVVELLNKNLEIEAAKQVVAMTKDYGIKVRLFFMVGAPGETSNTIDRNIEFITTTEPDLVTCASFVPLPGTPVWRNPEEFGIEILDRDFTKYSLTLHENKDVLPITRLLNVTEEEMMLNRSRFCEFLFETGYQNKG